MENDSIDPQGRIEMDYSQYDEAVQKLKPKAYQEGDIFCCLSGPDSGAEIHGMQRSRPGDQHLKKG